MDRFLFDRRGLGFICIPILVFDAEMVAGPSTSRFLVYTGTISYGIYLLEKIPLNVVKAFHLDKHAVLAFSITAAATYALAALSWNLLEKPFLRLKRFFETKAVPLKPRQRRAFGCDRRIEAPPEWSGEGATLSTGSAHLSACSRLQHGLPANWRWPLCRFGQNCRKRQTRQVGLYALRTITTPKTV